MWGPYLDFSGPPAGLALVTCCGSDDGPSIGLTVLSSTSSIPAANSYCTPILAATSSNDGRSKLQLHAIISDTFSNPTGSSLLALAPTLHRGGAVRGSTST